MTYTQVFNSANKLEATIRKHIKHYNVNNKNCNLAVSDEQREFAVLVLEEILKECGYDTD